MTESPRPILPYASSSTESGAPARLGPFLSPVEANLAMLRLQREGIECSLDGEIRNSALTGYGSAIAGMHLLVRPKDEAPARVVLRAIEDQRRERRLSSLAPCPSCDQRDTQRIIPWERWVGVSILCTLPVWSLSGVPSPGSIAMACAVVGGTLMLLPTTPLWRCGGCDRRFRAREPIVDDHDEPDPDTPD
jgi:hypothetical protein